MPLDVSLVAAAFNKIAGKKRKEIYSQLMQGTLVVSPLLNKLRTVSGIQKDQIYYGSNAEISEILQGWVDTKVKKGTMKLVPNEIRQRRHMIYTGIKPDALVGTIEGQTFDETKDITDQDLVKLMLDMITKQVPEDRIYKQLYRGKYIAPTDNVANPAENAVDGFNEIIEAGLEEANASKKINGIQIGNLDDNLIYEQLTTDLIMGINEKYRYRPMDAFISPDKYHRYLVGREESIGLRVNTADNNPVFIPNTLIRLNPEPSMVGSKRIFVTPDWNLVRIVDKKTDGASGLKAKDYAVDEVTIYGDYHEAFGFNYNKMVWTNNISNNGSGGGDENETFVS
jgi:hypothetical protein